MAHEIQIKKVTKYFAIKEAINKTVEHFIENKLSFSLIVEMEWSDKINKEEGMQTLIVFREDIFKFIDIDNTTKEEFNKLRLIKKHYLQIWRALL